MPDGNFTEFPIPYNTTDNPADKANKTTTINGLSLAQDRVLKSAQFSQAITGELMLANLTYTVVSTWT